jgi:outer membrane receptor protein involved in Fe transport
VGLRYRFEQIRGLSVGISASAMYINQADFLLWMNADSGAFRQNPESYAPLAGHRYNLDPYVEYFTPSGNRHTLRMRLYSVGNETVDIAKSSFAKLYYSEYRFLKKLGGETNWTSGTAFSRNTVVANLYEDHRGSNMAFYSQLDAKLPARVKISTGVRWEINSLNGEFYYSLPVFRAGANYQAFRSTFLRGSFGQGYRFPSVAEKFADAEVAGLRIFKNPELEPERGWSAEAGIKQGFGAGAWIGFMDLALFWTEYENMIEYLFGAHPEDTSAIPTFDDIGFKALNIGTARIIGAEFSLNAEGEAGPTGDQDHRGIYIYEPCGPIHHSGVRENRRWSPFSQVPQAASGKGRPGTYCRENLFRCELPV